jgi:hypothetical protein
VSLDTLRFRVADVTKWSEVEEEAVKRVMAYTGWPREQAVQRVKSAECHVTLRETQPPRGRGRARYTGIVSVTV